MKYVVRARKNPQDKAASPKWYPAPVYEGDVTTEDFAKDVADMCSLTPMDVIACMRSFITVVPKYLTRGFVINLDNFCRIKLGMKTKGAASRDDVNPEENIKGFRLIFSPKPGLVKTVQETPCIAFVDKTNAGWSN